MPRHIILVLFTLLFQVPAFGQKISPDGTATYYYFPQRKKSEGKLINGQREGVWTFFNTDGKVTGTETYANNQANGRCLYYHVSNGVLWTEGDYKDSKRDDLWKYYFANGKPSGSEVYKQGLMDGPAEYYDSVSNTRIAEGQHVNNSRDGVWRFYYMYTGKLKAEENYKGNLHGLSIYYDSTTGKKKSEGNYKNGKMHGDWTHYDSLTGAIRIIQTYDDGVPDGNVVFHYDSIIIKGKLTNGDMHGEWKTFDTSGKLLSVITYNNGLEVSGENYDVVTGLVSGRVRVNNSGNQQEWDMYTATNKLTTKKYYMDDDERKQIEYDTVSGKPIYEGELQNDERHGEWKYYDKKGRITSVEMYQNDLQDGVTMEYDNENDINTLYTYKAGQRHGRFAITTENDKWIEGTYANDSVDGPCYVYFPSGKLKRHLIFRNGEIVTDSCFDGNGELVKPYPFLQKSYFKGNVMTYIGDNLRYPEAAKQKGIEGKVLVRFTINESGLVSDVSVQKSLHPELNAEAVRLVSQMPPWQPLQMDRKRLRSHKTLPIVFWIPDSDKK